MNCKRVESQLSAFLDGELPGVEMLEIRRHLGRCGACAAEVDSLRALKDLLGGALEPAPGSEFESRLVAHVFTQRESKRIPTRVAVPAAFLATALAAAAIVWVLQGPQPDADPLSAGAEAGAQLDLDLQRDQAFYAGTDPLRTSAPIVPTSYDGQ